jgi:hypothetical protein
MKQLPVFVIAVLLLTSSTAGQAHHSLAATYRLSDTEAISGTIVQVGLREPHSFLHVEAPDRDGIMRRWSVEWDATTPVVADGHADHFGLRAGDRVRVVGHPGRNAESYRLLAAAITRLPEGNGD